MREGDIPSGVSKLTVPEAAQALGISPEAVRNRLSRGTLKSVKEEGTVYVLLEADKPRHTTDMPTDRPSDISRELVEELRNRVSYLERALEEERETRTEERRRHDTLMAQLMQRIPEIEAPRAARQEPPESPEGVVSDEQAEDAVRGNTEPSETLGGPGSGTARGSWWRRVFGG
jgi:DNA-binding Lrp family transcriptional regulator